MANFTAGTSFTDGVTNDVTAAKLNALVADAVPTSSLSLNSTTGTIGLFSSGTGTAATPAIQPTGDTNTGIFFPAADTIAFSEGGAESMRIDSSGNVGIGITPSQKLDVNGASSIRGALFLGDGSSSVIRKLTSSTPLTFANNGGSAEMTIDSSGNVGIGTTPSQKLDVNGGSAIRGTLFLGDGSSSVIRKLTSSTPLTFANNGGLAEMTINSSGNVGIGTTSPSAQLELSTDSAKKPSTNTWTIASDQRLKTNIINADNDRCYEIVKQVPLKRYSWKNEVYSQEQVRDRSKLGWIAQDVEAVFPKAVGTNRFAYNQVFEDVVTPELDSDGNAVLDENGVAKTKTEKRLVSEEVIQDCKDLNSDQIYAAMYGTIQKLIEKVEILEAKVTALEAA